ncbi:aminotransferase class III-fold pyridoxal phosphate-dependent enzyme [Paraburkholderia sartisoli]|uniref:aminotransferase class III-fold pyridoxal phosphate-dependent enzyme n=1 Tax=Paraburkholderia sartisoli TaxID=83784 RepID=UPI001FDEE67E|nr:aminotransferase class III-fold pyridoxal phosphate-dependent enzyme [Paraburkholderia sartisoli]
MIAYTRAHFNAVWQGETASLADLGIDSLSGAELLSSLERWLEISIPVDFLEYVTESTELVSALVELQQAPKSGSGSASAFESFVNPWLAKKLAQIHMDRSFVRADGAYLYDQEGEAYLDFLAQYGAVPFGHHPEDIWKAVDALRADAEPVFAQPSCLVSAGLLAERLIQLAPPGLRYVTFTNSGAESVEAALKMARHATGRTHILSTKNAFHGKTFGALSATGKSDYQSHFGLPLAGFDHIEYGNAAALDQHLASRPGVHAAFIVEPIQGEGGVHVPPKGYLAAVETICRRHGVLLIVDEVQTGLGRTGAMFACEYEGVRPDILLLSKALGGGLVPVGAVLCTEAAYSEKFALKHSSTFAGNALASRVGLATLERLTRNGGELLCHVRVEGAYLKQRLEAMRARFPFLIEEIRGQGFMLGIRLSADRARWPENFLGIAAQESELAQFVASYLLNVERIRFAPTLNRGDVLRVQPPLTATREHCDRAADALERALSVLASRDTGRFYRALLRREAPACMAVGVAGKAETAGLPAITEVTPPLLLSRGAADEHRFGFLIHPLDAQSYADYDPGLNSLNADELAEFAASMDGLIDPVVGSSARIESPAGAKARGDFIMISHTAAQLRQLSQHEAIAVLKRGIRLAFERGARIVGLGAYTSVVSGGGAQLLNPDVALTSGNSYTVAAGVEALDDVMHRTGRPWDASTAAVIGAAGAIGSCMAVLLSRRAARMLLIGNPAHARQIGRARLLAVARMIVEGALSTCDEIVLPDSVAAQIRRAAAHMNVASGQPDTDALIAQLEEQETLMLTGDIRVLGEADVALAATSFPGDVIDEALLRPGTIVCDISRPRSIPASIVDRRPDVLVIDGGIIALPGSSRIGPYGIAPGTAFACMAETMLLALEGRFENVSIGNTLDVREISRQRQLARKHGFALAGLQSFGRPLAEDQWQRFIGFTAQRALPLA